MEKESRRVQMTKLLLHNAMVQCLKEKPPEKLTVTEICQIADVNRTTYYKYFTDPIEQYHIAEDQTIAGLVRIIEDFDIRKIFQKKEMRKFVMAILDYVEERLGMFQAMDKYSALDYWVNLSYSMGDAFLAKTDFKGELSEDLTEMGAFAFTGAYALIFRWVTMGEPKDKEFLADSIIRYVMGVIRSKYKILPKF